MTFPEQEQPESPLWEYVPLAHFSKPPAPAKEALPKGFLGLWGRWKPSSSPAENLVRQDELRLLPEKVMDNIAPPPNWCELLPALEKAIKGWLQAENPGVAAVVGWVCIERLCERHPRRPRRAL